MINNADRSTIYCRECDGSVMIFCFHGYMYVHTSMATQSEVPFYVNKIEFEESENYTVS